MSTQWAGLHYRESNAGEGGLNIWSENVKRGLVTVNDDDTTALLE